jgi:hypothetical protein
MRKKRIELTDSGKHAGYIWLVPGRAGNPGGTYLWVGDSQIYGYTKNGIRSMRAFAHAILRAIGDEGAR